MTWFKLGVGNNTSVQYATYNGNFTNGERDGQGSITWYEPGTLNIIAKYEGNFSEGVFSGNNGSYYYQSDPANKQLVDKNNQYQGDWERGVQSGNGTSTYKDNTNHI